MNNSGFSQFNIKYNTQSVLFVITQIFAKSLRRPWRFFVYFQNNRGECCKNYMHKIVDKLPTIHYNGGINNKRKDNKMKEAQEIANYIAKRLEYWQNELKKEKDADMKIMTEGQIFESTKILKHIQYEYGINPQKGQE